MSHTKIGVLSYNIKYFYTSYYLGVKKIDLLVDFCVYGSSENDSVQRIISETASIIVVINGLAITAGSR